MLHLTPECQEGHVVTLKGTAPQVALAFLPLSQYLTSVQDLSSKSVMEYFFPLRIWIHQGKKAKLSALNVKLEPGLEPRPTRHKECTIKLAFMSDSVAK